MEIDRLKAFRQAAYQHLGKARDATFELTDAVLLTRTAYCLADLSLSPVFRRRWPSIYEALQDTRPQRNKLMQLYIKQMPTDVRPLLAGDHTVWPRPDAVTLQERTIEHYCTNVPGNRPITKGQGYSTLAWIPEATGTWALPLRHERITSWENPIEKAVWQLKQVCQYLSNRPITLWDSEYGCAPFVLKTAGIAADKLMRLRSNLCLWGAPPPYSGKGRPRTQRSGKVSKPLWLAWVGEEMPPLSEVWRLYLRRFAVDHWYRFIKQRLHWTLPKLSTKKQCERWSDLMPLLSWELWLAREIVADNPLPWQHSQLKLTPGRVAQAMGGVLAAMGTPAHPPKPRGKSSGWPTGKQRQPRTRYPVVKKGSQQIKKSCKKS